MTYLAPVILAINLHLSPVISYQKENRIEYLTWQQASHTVNLNAISVKDISCTFASLTININKKGKFAFTGKLVYLKIFEQWTF